jgi:hypothetical protein
LTPRVGMRFAHEIVADHANFERFRHTKQVECFELRL